MKPLVSIIVPVYNVAKYVQSCLESISRQLYENIEIVIVDDGSTDESHSICEAFAASERRPILFITQPNAGLSAARNIGIKNCHGDLVVFVDSDDVVSPLYVMALVYAMTDSGCSMATIRQVPGFLEDDSPVLEDDPISACKYSIVSEVEYQKQLLYQHAFNGAQWRIYRRDMLNGDYFPVGIYFEDLATTYKYVHGKGDVAILSNEKLYGYRFRRGSIMRSGYSEIKIRSAIDIADELKKNILAWYPDLDKAVASRCFSVNRTAYATTRREHEKARKLLWSRIVDNRKTVLFDPDARKRERIAALSACVGQKAFQALCYGYQTYKIRH